MKRRRVPWSILVSGLVVIVVLGSIVRSVLAGPAVTPHANDVRNAARVAVPNTGGQDERVPIIEGDWVGGNGVVEPAQRETRVALPVAGRIQHIAVREGQFVQQGDVLVELDNAPERAALAAAEADVEVSRAGLQRTLHGLRREDVDAAIAEAESAHSRSLLSAEVLQRNEALARTGAVTADELDRARRTASADDFTFRLLDARRRAAVAGSRYEDILVARAQLAASVARRDQAQAALDRLTLKAPLAGEILQLRLREGEYYTPGGADALVVMGDTRTLRVRVDVDERDVGRVALNRSAFVTADAFRGVRFAGHVVEIGQRMGRKNIRTDDPTERIDTKILEVVIQLDRADRLIPGQRVMSYIQSGETNGGATPPSQRAPIAGSLQPDHLASVR